MRDRGCRLGATGLGLRGSAEVVLVTWTGGEGGKAEGQGVAGTGGIVRGESGNERVVTASFQAGQLITILSSQLSRLILSSRETKNILMFFHSFFLFRSSLTYTVFFIVFGSTVNLL